MKVQNCLTVGIILSAPDQYFTLDCGTGKGDIITEVSLLASQMAMERKGHLDAALHVITHLKMRSNAHLVFNPTYPAMDFLLFKEVVPTNAPEP